MFSLGLLSASNVISLEFDQEHTPRDRRIPLDTKIYNEETDKCQRNTII